MVDGDNNVARYPKDFRIDHLGTLDLETGTYTEENRIIMTGIEAKKYVERKALAEYERKKDDFQRGIIRNKGNNDRGPESGVQLEAVNEQ